MTLYLYSFYTNTGQIKKARKFLSENQKIIEYQNTKLTQAYIEILDNNYDEAIQITESITEDQSFDQLYFQQGYHSKYLQLGLIFSYKSDKEMASKHFEKAKVFLLSKIDTIQHDYSMLYSALGIAYAGLGMKKEAIEAGRKALDIISFSDDAFMGYYSEIDMVKILLLIGEYEDALTRLEYIISKSGLIAVEILKLDPFWNPIREMEGFKAIINNPEYQVKISNN